MDILSVRNQIKREGINFKDLPLRVAFYARVSTDFMEQLNSLENQKQYFTEYIGDMPNWEFAGGYIDEGISGVTTKKREKFNEMIDDGLDGKFDLIVTKEVSRFARNTLDSIQYTRQLLANGVAVYFQNDNINTLDEDSEFRLTIMASMAQDESRKISSRVRWGHHQAIKNGVVLGNSNIFGYRKADRIIPNSYAQADFIRRHFPAQAAKLGTIVNFVDLEKYHPAADSGSGPQTYRIVSTARVSKRKNLSALIYAVAHARQAGYDVRADWYGCVKDTQYLAFCQSEIARLGLNGLVEVHPETQDVASAYRKADICCLPSYYEGTPNALIEAMACGLPAFVSDVSDNARYCIDGRHGFTFNPADNDSVAAALMKLLALGKDGLKAFGKESRRIAEEKLVKERFIGEWLDVLEKL